MSANNSLDFVYVDVNIFETLACKRIRRKYGNAGLAVFVRLMLEIAKNGYYLPWDADTPADLADDWREDGPKIIEGAVSACLETGFYSREAFNACHILTGKQIQENFKQANTRRKRPLVIDARYWVISRDGFPACVTFTDGIQGRPFPIRKNKTQLKKFNGREPTEEPPETNPTRNAMEQYAQGGSYCEK